MDHDAEDDDLWLCDQAVMEAVDAMERQYSTAATTTPAAQTFSAFAAPMRPAVTPKPAAKQVVGKGKAPQRQQATLEAFGLKSVTSALSSTGGTAVLNSQPPSAKHRQAIKFNNECTTYAPHSATHQLCRENLESWIYPVNYPKRSYQFDMIRTSLLHNTLVCLPTGLGKTFIAAVVMFNYFRWFPSGKIMFMAPTKPLVAQQMEACFKITGLSQLETAELNGSQPPPLRQTIWKEKRVFFLTPQILQNDIQSKICSADDIVLLVVDEAHRATGNYAYSQVVKLVQETNPNFRMLALSATPGTDLQSVQEVIDNLNIARIELRTEESADIKQYIHSKISDTIAVPLSDHINGYMTRYMSVVKFYLESLNKSRAVFETDPTKLTKFLILQLRNTWRSRNSRGARNPANGYIEMIFAVLMSLYHAVDLLTRHGLTPFFRYLDGVISGKEESGTGPQAPKGTRGQLVKNAGLISLLSDLRTEMALFSYVSHPKLERMEVFVLEHFLNYEQSHPGATDSTRIMIFSEYRDSVEEIVTILNKHQPMLRVMAFIGQASSKNGKGCTQKEQMKVIQDFQNGGYNILVATSIGEEGLDIGEVDLIICYDAQSSPIRMLQRMGRTGRKRDGRIITFVTEGKEEAQFQKVQVSYRKVQAILSSGKLKLYTEDRRMIPAEFKPVPVDTVMVIPEYQLKTSGSTSRSTKPNKSSSTLVSGEIFEVADWRIYCSLYRRNSSPPKLDPSRKLHWQSTPQQSKFGHSNLSTAFVGLVDNFEKINTRSLSLEQWEASLESKLGIADSPKIQKPAKRSSKPLEKDAAPLRKKRKSVFDLIDEMEVDTGIFSNDDDDLPDMNACFNDSKLAMKYSVKAPPKEEPAVIVMPSRSPVFAAPSSAPMTPLEHVKRPLVSSPIAPSSLLKLASEPETPTVSAAVESNWKAELCDAPDLLEAVWHPLSPTPSTKVYDAEHLDIVPLLNRFQSGTGLEKIAVLCELLKLRESMNLQSDYRFFETSPHNISSRSGSSSPNRPSIEHSDKVVMESANDFDDFDDELMMDIDLDAIARQIMRSQSPPAVKNSEVIDLTDEADCFGDDFDFIDIDVDKIARDIQKKHVPPPVFKVPAPVLTPKPRPSKVHAPPPVMPVSSSSTPFFKIPATATSSSISTATPQRTVHRQPSPSSSGSHSRDNIIFNRKKKFCIESPDISRPSSAVGFDERQLMSNDDDDFESPRRKRAPSSSTSPMIVIARKQKKASKFIEFEADVESDVDVSADEASDYASSLSGFIVTSQDASSAASSPNTPSFYNRPGMRTDQQHGSKFRMKFRGEVTLSQKVTSGVHQYIWSNRVEEDIEEEDDADSFVVDDDEIEFDDENSQSQKTPELVSFRKRRRLKKMS